MNGEAIGTLKDDVESLDEKQKINLADGCFVAAMDVDSKKGKAKKITVDAGIKDGYKLAIIAVKETTTTTTRQTAHERLISFGLAETIVKNLAFKLEAGQINSSHISDIRKTNLLDEISILDVNTQQDAVEEIIRNRNEKDQINSEHISLLTLKKGKVNKFLVENWYRGFIRTIEKMILQSDVNRDVVNELLLEQNQHLVKRIKTLMKKLDNLLILLDQK